MGAFVSTVVRGGAADATGTLCVGDLITEVDGTAVREMKYSEIIELLQYCTSPDESDIARREHRQI